MCIGVMTASPPKTAVEAREQCAKELLMLLILLMNIHE
jgi:hypothetical protein